MICKKCDRCKQYYDLKESNEDGELWVMARALRINTHNPALDRLNKLLGETGQGLRGTESNGMATRLS